MIQEVAPQTLLVQLYLAEGLRQLYEAVLTPLEPPAKATKEVLANEIWMAAAIDPRRRRILIEHLDRTIAQYQVDLDDLLKQGARLQYYQGLAHQVRTRALDLAALTNGHGS